jgi:hypothetical protein
MSEIGQSSGMGRVVDIGSASLFAGAAGYSALLLSSPAAGAAAAAIAFVGAHRALGRIDSQPRFALREFALGGIEEAEEDELLLTELTELLLVETVKTDDELLLDDRLAEPEPDSRVVRLFDPRTMPTAGELHARVERHLSKGAAYPDATAELHDALTALRNSLR